MRTMRWLMGALILGLGCSDGSLHCMRASCLGPEVTVELVDAAGARVAARGEVRSGPYPGRRFDCSTAAESKPDVAGCTDGVLKLGSLDTTDDVRDIRFQRGDGSFTDWEPVPLTIEEEVLDDFNGPGCPCTVHHGTAEPVTVPVDAR